MEIKNFDNIPKEKLCFAKNRDFSHDKKIETKSAGYMRDAWRRFKKNKASLAASVIIVILFLFAIIVPFVSQYGLAYSDPYYKFTLPKNNLFVAMGLDFWDGCTEKDLTQAGFDKFLAMGVETGHSSIKNDKYETYSVRQRIDGVSKEIKHYVFRLDSYHEIGAMFKNVTAEEYEQIQAYQDETGIQVIYPITNKALRPQDAAFMKDGNYWYKTTSIQEGYSAAYDSEGNFQNIYNPYTGSDNYTSRVRFEGEGNYKYNYAIKNQSGYEIRINYYEYFVFNHTYVLKDGITEPSFLFGTTDGGKDILAALASGAQFSFLLALFVAAVNLVIGAIYGAIEGYYGGAVDMLMERFSDILVGIPFLIVITLVRLHFASTVGMIACLLIAFVLTGWTGTAATMRMQFYRYKNREYVLAARTLGAKDRRLMFRHILPNSLGTLVTSSVMVIPGVIFQESMLSYLGIVNVSSDTLTSVGTLLAQGQQFLATFPHMILFPSIFISLLMLSFNLFGNGLRDAFNPSLRGVED